MTQSNTSQPPHLFTFYADFAKTALTISVTSISVLVTFSNSILDVREKMRVAVLVGITLLLLLLVAGISIVVIGLISKALRGIRVGVVRDLSLLLNIAFWCLIFASIVFISAGVVRFLSNAPKDEGKTVSSNISLKVALRQSVQNSFITCHETPSNRLAQMDLSADRRSWVAQIIATCPNESGLPQHLIELTIDFDSGTITRIRFL